jgi:hypothetical protein
MAKHKWEMVCPRPKDLVVPVRIDPKGALGPTKSAARGAAWRQTSHGFYVPATTPTDVPEQRIVEQSVRLPAFGAVTGWAACRLHRANFFDGLKPDGKTLIPVPLALGRRGNIRRDAQVLLNYDLLAPDELTVACGVPVTRRERAVFDAMRFAPSVRETTVALEMAVGAGLTSIERMTAYARDHAGWKHMVQVRAALALAREHSRSPNEVRFRLVWELDAGLPRPQINCPIHDLDGRLLGIADLIDLEAGLVAEFDGEDHRSRERHTKDLAKDEALRGVGLEVTRVSGTDLRDRPLVVRRLRSARSRARFEPEAVRRWAARPLANCAEQKLVEKEVMGELYTKLESQPLVKPDSW